MQALLVGADRLGNIPALLSRHGYSIGRHVDGRSANHQRKPSHIDRVDLVILFTDFLSHSVMHSYKEAADKASVPLVACRRSTVALEIALQKAH